MMALGCLGCLLLINNQITAVAAVPALLIYRAASGMLAPVKMEVQNQQVTGNGRTTVIAAFTIFSKVCFASVDSVVSRVSAYRPSLIPMAALLMGIVCITLVMIWRNRTLRKG